MQSLRDATREHETILVSDKGADAYTVLGPKLELRDSSIVLRITPRMLTLASPRLIRCSIEAKRALGKVSWCDSYLEDCRFSGTFNDNDFGHWPKYFNAEGGLVGGDFSAAQLNGCRFFNVDTDNVVWPKWPCFTLIQPVDSAAFRALSSHHRWRFFAEAYTEVPGETTAVTGYAPYLVKKYGGTAEELQAALSEVDNVRF